MGSRYPGYQFKMIITDPNYRPYTQTHTHIVHSYISVIYSNISRKISRSKDERPNSELKF